MTISTQEQLLCEFLRDLPRLHKNRYGDTSRRELLSNLFWSLAGGQDKYIRLLFPDGRRPHGPSQSWKLREAQGAVDGAEYTEAARGKACGHIFKSGEATYRCKTCSSDETCVLCSRCYDASDHTGHMVYISISPGNSGCCDCGDAEAWRIPVHCTIHTDHRGASKSAGKAPEALSLPEDLLDSIRMTIGRAFDYICDVVSCSPEHLRGSKSAEVIRLDERMSRLTSLYYNGDVNEDPIEFAVLLWNDEKHTIKDVQDQVARACKLRESEAIALAYETDDVGRTIVKYGTDIDRLLDVAKIIEQIKVTVTIRSARDTFREQMCGTIIEWLGDIAGCSVGDDHNVLRQVICEEMLKTWQTGSEASNAMVGRNGIDDQELDDRISSQQNRFFPQAALFRAGARAAAAMNAGGDDDDDDDDGLFEGNDETYDEEDVDYENEQDVLDAAEVLDVVMREAQMELEAGTDADVDMIEDDVQLENQEATMAGYPPPPPPPPPPPAALTLPSSQNSETTRPSRDRDRDLTPSDSDTAEPLIPATVYAKVNIEIPKTPGIRSVYARRIQKPPRYWLETPEAFHESEDLPLYENLFQRVRLDWMILFDLRLWKKARVDLRDLYISTVVTIPQFKRILGLRFAGLYTLLAQLYLIADREPDHSIINISLQMLTTPSITSEIVERGNFLTNLMAILYTFLTTRQVDHPSEIQPNETLNFEAGSVTNRRMYHFFMDLRYLFGSEHVQERLRTEDRYILQFLDLVKLHQGICPNVRAIGEHVEYETDAWISASLITREINRLCRQFSDSFKWKLGEDMTSICKAIRLTAKAVILSCLGTERKRFKASEIKEEIKFKNVTDYEFETDGASEHKIVRFTVDQQPISFHHALHYTLSWLVECGKSMTRDQLVQLLSFTTEDLLMKPKAMGARALPINEYSSEDHLMAAFDYPLRVCAWLAQMKASMWVRNGMSLRHQAGTYRGVAQRDVSHHRDIFLLQAAMVVCPPTRVLATIIDRFGMEYWMKGLYEQKSDVIDDVQQLDVVEEMVHLLIVLLSDRTSLLSLEDEPNPHVLAMRRDITHVLCFKPLSFSDICGKLPDKFQEQEECQDILDEMTTFKAPEGLSDVGTFELKQHFLEDLDPYIAHYNKNQREEAENIYRSRMAKKTGRALADIVFEPRLRTIKSGIFKDLAAFTRTGIFSQIIYYALLYPLKAAELTPNVPASRIETFLQVVLHLVLLAVAEDNSAEDDTFDDASQSFVYIALTRSARSNFMHDAPQAKTIVSVLEMMSQYEVFKSCHSKVCLVLRRMRQKRPRTFETSFTRLGVSIDRVSTASPANNSAEEDRQRRKQQALDRQAKVMAQFQQQQKTFLDNQSSHEWDEGDVSDDEMRSEVESRANYWNYPTGTCILCQEETNDSRLYGTFANLAYSNILRQTALDDPDFVREVYNVPQNLDRSAEHLRPFGVSGENREQVRKISPNGKEIVAERQGIGKGFPPNMTHNGPVSIGCGHIMHYKCFELYYEATVRRHTHQIARHHPERLDLNEFVCPLCKAQGNAFLPIIWKGKEESFPGVLVPAVPFEQWLGVDVGGVLKRAQKEAEPDSNGRIGDAQYQELFLNQHREDTLFSLSGKLHQLHSDAWLAPTITPTTPASARPLPSHTPGEFPTDVPELTGSTRQLWDPTDPAILEIVAVYRRLWETMRTNGFVGAHSHDSEEHLGQNELDRTDVLAIAVGFSISAVEIQQRGISSSLGLTLLETVPQQSLTHLRILADTAASYVSVGGLKHGGKNKAAKEFSKDCDMQIFQLFVGHPSICPYDPEDPRIHQLSPLLNQDPFLFLTKCSIGLVSILGADIMHLVRLCYTVEVLKVIVAMARSMPGMAWANWIGLGPDLADNCHYPAFRKLCAVITRVDIANLQEWPIPDGDTTSGFTQPWVTGLDACRQFVQKYVLVFLRKCILLLYTRFGTNFNSHISPDPSADEIDRLTEVLRLPTLDELCATIVDEKPQNQATDALQCMVAGWLKHYAQHNTKLAEPKKIPLAHPVIFELVGLPKNYDTLMEETMKTRCPTTGKDVSDPMLCLFCGEIFCGQSICCLKQERSHPDKAAVSIGGAQLHMRRCQRHIGLFINIRKCTVFYLHHMSGSWMVAPYIDKYGEVDPGLRHGRQLFLHQKRYDALLRTVWLQHGVPSVISRKLESETSNGGWETI